MARFVNDEIVTLGDAIDDLLAEFTGGALYGDNLEGKGQIVSGLILFGEILKATYSGRDGVPMSEIVLPKGRA